MVINTKEFEKMLEELNDINDDNVGEKLKDIVPNYHPSPNPPIHE